MAKARILVIDDDRPTVTIVQVVLKKEGYEVFTALDGKEGLDKARELKPNLIILDIMMPGMDGYSVARRIKNDPDMSGTAVLMLSAKGGIEDPAVAQSYKFAGRVQDRLAGFESGAVDFLTKPVKAKDLTQKVKAVLWAGGVF
jgi:two-component system, OmpR family, alkaline phosphatase synthesis response regulator PhoP